VQPSRHDWSRQTSVTSLRRIYRRRRVYVRRRATSPTGAHSTGSGGSSRAPTYTSSRTSNRHRRAPTGHTGCSADNSRCPPNTTAGNTCCPATASTGTGWTTHDVQQTSPASSWLIITVVIIIIHANVYGAVIIANHCESSPGSF